MSKHHRFDARRDLNEPEIIAALEQAGALVQRLSETGLFDLLVGYNGALWLLEVKNPNASNPRIRKQQETFMNKWLEYPLYVVWTPDEALRAIGAIEGE
jgi:exosome complex RNA-binding protein Rrp4